MALSSAYLIRGENAADQFREQNADVWVNYRVLHPFTGTEVQAKNTGILLICTYTVTDTYTLRTCWHRDRRGRCTRRGNIITDFR